MIWITKCAFRIALLYQVATNRQFICEADPGVRPGMRDHTRCAPAIPCFLIATWYQGLAGRRVQSRRLNEGIFPWLCGSHVPGSVGRR